MRVIGGWLGQWSGGWLGPGAPGLPSGYMVGSAAVGVAASGIVAASGWISGSTTCLTTAALHVSPAASMSGAVYISISAALQAMANPRVLVEIGQSRVLSISASSRVLTTTQQSRWLGVGVESRVLVTEAESRALEIDQQSRIVQGSDDGWV